ncbi:ABC1 kinase family protein [Micromonospora sp. NPDC047620]|uniref:ABC1 kinase family protein n=1 Tax=Micromonospora sp. NPDC047620 TaxID=3364251 RepID=UPI003723B099
MVPSKFIFGLSPLGSAALRGAPPSGSRRPPLAPGGAGLGARAVVIGSVATASLAAGLAAAAGTALRHGRPAGRRRFAREVARTVARLGPTFIKAAQVLGTRRDVVPALLCDELSMLQDDVPPMDAAQSRAALREVYGDRLDTVFASVEETPVASGSIACVYRATLPDGATVAVKLRRPGIGPRMAADLGLLRRGASVVARLPMFRGVPVREVVDSLCESVLGQLDLGREGRDLDRLREDLGAVPRVRVPRVHTAASRPAAIVMDFIPDLAVDTGARCPRPMRRTFAASTLTVVYQMLFINGFVHCDLHPGNLYFTRSGQVVVLDAGFSVQLSDKMRGLFADFFLNMSIGRGDRCAAIVLESAIGVADDADVPAFTEGVKELVARSYRLSAKEFSLIAFAGELFDLQRRYGVAASPELVFPLLSLLVVEGTVRSLDPDIDFQETAKPVLNRALFGIR